MSRYALTSSPLRTATALIAVLVTATILYLAREVLIPLALAILLAFLLAPLVRRLERLRFPRGWAVLIAVGLATASIGAVGYLVEGQIEELAARLPQYKNNLFEKLESLRMTSGGVLGRAGDTINELGKEVAKQTGSTEADADPPKPVRIVESPTPPMLQARNLIGPVLRPLATAGIVVVFSIFMLVKREDVRDRFIRLVGLGQLHVTTTALDDAAQRVSRYLLLQTIINGMAGLTIGIGLFIIDVPGALIWGLLTAVMRFVPYIGTWVAAALPVIVSAANSGGWTQPLIVLGMILVIELLVANVVEPLLFGSHTGVSPLAILAAAVFWTWLWGTVGLFLATPLTVCLAVIGKHVPPLAFLDVLLGDAPVLTPETRLYQRLLAGDSEEAAEIVSTFAEDKTLAEVYDQLILPAIRLAENVRHRGGLDPERYRALRDMLMVTIEDQGDRAPPAPPREAEERGLVLCLPARDQADHLVARMVERLLSLEGMRVEVPTEESLTGEMIEQVATSEAAVVCISAVPPGAVVYTRVLCKRLRARFPEMPIVVGMWGSEDPAAVKERLGVESGVYVVSELKDAVEQIRSLAGYAPPVEAKAPEESGPK